MSNPTYNQLLAIAGFSSLPLPTTFAFRQAMIGPGGVMQQRLARVPLARNAPCYFCAKTTRAGGSAASDSNDGLDGIGFNLSGATYTASTQTLAKTSGFTSYVWHPNDLVYLSSGVTAGLYKIASKTSANAIVLAAVADSVIQGSLAAPTSNATGIASSTGPFTTIAHTLGLTNFASTGLARARFNRGDVWSESTIPAINGSLITVDDYGIGPKPFWNRFAANYINTGWVQVGSSNAWTNTCPSGTGWIRESHRQLVAYQRIFSQGSDAANATYVAATPLSFCVNSISGNGLTITINAGVGVNPNNINGANTPMFEVNTTNTNDWSISGDNIRLANIRLDGYAQSFSTAAWCLFVDGGLGSEVVIDGVEVYYSGYHCFGSSTGGSNAGGYNTWINCKAGYMTTCTGQASETAFICYSQGGADEYIQYQCEVPYGTLPDDSWVASGQSPLIGRGADYYSHASSGNTNLLVYWSCKTGLGQQSWPPVLSPAGVSLPTASVLSAVRGFIVDHQCLGYMVNSGLVPGIAPGNMAQINCKIELAVTPVQLNTALCSAAFGWIWNTTLSFDGSFQHTGLTTASPNCSGIFGDFAGTATPILWNNHVSFINAGVGGGNYVMGVFNSLNSPYGAFAFNNVFQIQGYPTSGTGGNNLNITNNAANIGGNAYGNITTVTGTNGFDQDPGAVVLGAFIEPGIPQPGDQRYQAAVAIPGGVMLQYDQNWNLRPLIPSIGPLDTPVTRSINQSSMTGVGE